MPRSFDNCVKKGGRVRTIKKGGGKGRLVCFPKGGGKAKIGGKRGHKKRGKRG